MSNDVKHDLLKENEAVVGEWIKYGKGSDCKEFINSVNKYFTGYYGYYESNLSFEKYNYYVYYTPDEGSGTKVPRIIIETSNTDIIRDIRGIARGHNIEDEMLPVLHKKLEEFPDEDWYFKAEYDANLLALIENKTNNGIELSIDEIKFLYEIDYKVQGFDLRTDPRLYEIRGNRNKYQDVARVFGVEENEVAFSVNEWYPNADDKNIKIFIGSVSETLREMTSRNIVLPQYISGDVILGVMDTCKSTVKFPQEVGGSLYSRGITNLDKVTLPQRIGGSLYLWGITNLDKVTLPQKIGGNLDFDSLENVDFSDLHVEVGGEIRLGNFKNLHKDSQGEEKLQSKDNQTLKIKILKQIKQTLLRKKPKYLLSEVENAEDNSKRHK